MASVTAGGPGLVAVSSDGSNHEAPTGRWSAVVWTSVDGLSWSRVPHDETVFGGEGDQSMTGVAVGGPGLVAVGHDGTGDAATAAVWTSVDGLGWTRVPDDEAVFDAEGAQWVGSVAVGGPGLVAVVEGSAEGVWASVDGLTWSRIPHDEAVVGDASVGSPNAVIAVGPAWSLSEKKASSSSPVRATRTRMPRSGWRRPRIDGARNTWRRHVMMRQFLFVFALVLTVMLVLVACGGDDDAAAPAPPPPPAEPALPPAEPEPAAPATSQPSGDDSAPTSGSTASAGSDAATTSAASATTSSVGEGGVLVVEDEPYRESTSTSYATTNGLDSCGCCCVPSTCLGRVCAGWSGGAGSTVGHAEHG